MRNRGQVTIFIILAILLVAAIVLLFIFLRGRADGGGGMENPAGFIDSCVKNVIEPSAAKVLENGGLIEPENYILYQGEKYNYLCYQENYFLPCVNQYPLLENVVEEQIKEDSDFGVGKCFDDLEGELKKKGYGVSGGGLSFEIELSVKKILIHIDKRLDISKETSQSFDGFEVEYLSSLPELVAIGREIVNQESRNCYFDYNSFMVLYPEYKIRRISYDEARIYRIIDRKSEEEIKFAVRGCVIL